MKQYGLLGKGTGKLGASVFAISGGEQIVREYNPNVSNPNTDAQINQRSKFKLMSQIAADLAPVIVIPKDGLVSARNKFVSKNIGLVVATAGEATVNYVALQLTASDSAFPAVTGSIDNQGVLAVELAKMTAADVQKVVYCAFAKDDTNQLSLIGTTIIDRADATNNFATTFANAADAYVVYAYGIKANAIAANPNYDNYSIQGATDIARLVASHSISLDASGTTRTSGVLVAADATRFTKVIAPTLEGAEALVGEVLGPCTLNASSQIQVQGENIGVEPVVSNGKMTCLNGDDVQEVDLTYHDFSSRNVFFKLGEEGTFEDIYILNISFDFNGYHFSLDFAQP